MKNNMNKKAQEEIVGFVLIVVIVSVILVIFLGIMLSNKTQSGEYKSKDIEQFLESLMQFTTDCAINYEPAYSKLNELVQQCYSLSKCTSGKNPCDIAKETIKNTVELSFKIERDSINKGYEFISVINSSLDKPIIEIKKGECASAIKGGIFLLHTNEGPIINTLKICFYSN